MNEETMPSRVSLEEIFHPRGVAVVGASGSGKIGFAESVIFAMTEAGYTAIYPVNPKYREILGFKCYPDLKSIEKPVDHVIVSIPTGSVMHLLDDCARKKVKSVQFFTAGFRESGDPERETLETQMLKKAREAGFRIIGPNCIGLFVPESKVVNTVSVSYDPGPIAFMSQSGGFASNMIEWGDPRGLRFSKVVSYGNGLDIDEAELLAFFAGDSKTEIIAVYIEGVRDGKRFLAALEKAAARKPVVIYKGGRTEAGKRAALGHTASMTSSVAILEAACRQHNAILVKDIEEMIDVLVTLRYTRPMPGGNTMAIIGAGGGPCVLAGDAIEKEGLGLPPFSAACREKLKAKLPVDGSIFGNPLDTPNMATAGAAALALDILGKESDIDMLVYHIGFHPISRWGISFFATDAFLAPFLEAADRVRRHNGKPVILALHPPLDLQGMKEFLAAQKAFVDAGIPVFHAMDKMAGALAKVLQWRKKRLSR
jgi:acyl-CoA synthetase (NDP forming)